MARQLPHRLLLHDFLGGFLDFQLVECPELRAQFGELVALAVAVGARLPKVGNEATAGLEARDESGTVAGGTGSLEIGDQHKALELA